jgi:hypothetical protein
VGAQPYLLDWSLPRALGLRTNRVGDGEAYYYHEDRAILLWRCRLLGPYGGDDTTGDINLRAMWDAFERLLLERFHDARLMLTPSWCRPHGEALWLRFIQSHGYTRPSPAGIPNAAFLKDLDHASPHH